MITVEELHKVMTGERIAKIERAVNVDNGFTLTTENGFVLKVEYSCGGGPGDSGISVEGCLVEDAGKWSG